MKEYIPICLIAAVSSNGVIGNKNALPWHLKGDLAHFKALTMGNPIIMGRSTFDSIGKPLAHRTNIVVTRNGAWRRKNALSASCIDKSLAMAVSIAKMAGQKRVFIIGGANIYRQTIHLADVLYITEVDGTISGDVIFPKIDINAWKKVGNSQDIIENGLSYRFVEYQRR